MAAGRPHLQTRVIWPVLSGLLAGLLVQTCQSAAAEEAIAIRPVIDGVLIGEGPLRLEAGKTSTIGVQITDPRRGFPLGDLHPALWIRPAIEGRGACAAAVDRYLSLGPNAGLDIDLNGYLLATLNRDHSIGVIDPRLNLATSNLLSLTPRTAKASAWWLDQGSARLFVASAEAGSLEVIDLLSGEMTTAIDDLEGAGSIAAFPDLDRLWVAGDTRQEAVALSSLARLGTIAMPAGDWQLESDRIGLRLLALEREGGRFQIHHPASGALEKTVILDGPRSMFVHDAKGDAVYVAGAGQSSIDRLFLDLDQAETMPLPTPIDRLSITADGDHLAGLDSESGTLVLIDPAQLRPTHVLAFDGRPDQITASDDYLYLRERQTGFVSLVHLPSLDDRKAPGALRLPIGRAGGPDYARFDPAMTAPSAIIPLVDGGGAIIASPSDKTLYLYMETGMQAPSNGFRLWTEPPEAVLILDRSLTERRAGVYETVLHPKSAGAFELVFYLPTPKMVRCLPLSIDGSGPDLALAERPPRLVWTGADMPVTAGTPIDLQFRLEQHDGRPGPGVAGDASADDAEVMVLQPGSNWHWRGRATPTGDRGFAVSLLLPKPGSYQVLVRAPGQNFDFQDQRPLTIDAISEIEER